MVHCVDYARISPHQLGYGNYNAAAQQTQSFNVTAALPILDIDDGAPSTPCDAASYGVLLIRYLFGYREGALTAGTISISVRRNVTQIAAHILASLTRFDVDGDGKTIATTHGILVLRRLLGITQGIKGSNQADADAVLAIDALKL